MLDKNIQLSSVCNIGNGFAFKSTEFKSAGVPLLRISNIDNERVSFDNKCVYVESDYLLTHDKFIVKKGDVVIALSGATTGKYGIYELDVPALLNQRIGIIKQDDSRSLNSRYFYYYLGQLKAEILRKAQGAAQPNISTKELGQFKIPLPPLTEQKKIADILDAADSLRQKDQQLVEHYDRLTQSLFLELFGDPVNNPMGWDTIHLEKIAEISSGVTKGRKHRTDPDLNIPYMRVANVQDGYLSLEDVKTIPGTENDLLKFKLLKGDVLLTEGGDPDKLGRGAVWEGEIENCIHQNHIFKVRITCPITTPIYLSKLCGSEYGKRYFLKSGKQTTGIASINKTQLRKFPVYLPPKELQSRFNETLVVIKKNQRLAQQALKKSGNLFNSLLQRAFNGELTSSSECNSLVNK